MVCPLFGAKPLPETTLIWKRYPLPHTLKNRVRATIMIWPHRHNHLRVLKTLYEWVGWGMNGQDILCGISKVPFEIPHWISCPHIERCVFHSKGNNQKLLVYQDRRGPCKIMYTCWLIDWLIVVVVVVAVVVVVSINHNEHISIKTHKFPFGAMHFKMPSTKFRYFVLRSRYVNDNNGAIYTRFKPLFSILPQEYVGLVFVEWN